MENKELIDWLEIKSQLKEEYQIEDWADWMKDKRVDNVLSTFISLKYLVNQQLKEKV